MMTAGQYLLLRAPAKINWALQVTGRRADGYHDLHSLLQSISVYDQVELSVAEEDSCTCCPPVAGQPSDNLAWRAWCLLREQFALDAHLAVHINKQIPAGGGLGGGSADAAAVLLGINSLFGLGLSLAELCRLGFGLGADIPFCLHGGLAEIKGAGEEVFPCAKPRQYPLLLATPAQPLATARVFAAYDQLAVVEQPVDITVLSDALQRGDWPKIAAGMSNMLEQAALSLCPPIKQCQVVFAAHGLPSLMSGSGSCVFALSDGDRAREEAAMRALSARAIAVQRVQTLTSGVEISTGTRRV